MRDETLIKEEKAGSVTGVLEYGNAGILRWRSASLEIGLFILRLSVGGLMLFHGIAKLTNGIDMMKPMLAANGLPDWLIYGLYIAEVLAPVMIIIGFWTRLAALAVVFDMIMAIVLVHSQHLFTLHPGGGWAIEIEAFYLLTALALYFTGAGKYRVAGSRSRWD
jgi:putative oxidoreductase